MANVSQTIEQNPGGLPLVGAVGLNTNQNINVGGTSNFDASNSSGTFKTSTGAVTLSGSTTLAANKNFTAAAGTGSFDFSAATGAFKFPTGAITGMVSNIIDSNAATLTLTAAQTGSLVLLDRAAGTTVTLPAPVVGLNFSFCVTTAVTSNNHKVITDAGTTFILGGVVMTEAADTNAGLGALFNGTTHVAILMNGTTTGGIIGTFFNMTCVTATQWAIEGIVAGSGTLATCASTS